MTLLKFEIYKCPLKNKQPIKTMMIGEISFCDQTGFNIKTDETKKYILDRLFRKYGLRIITKHFEKFEDRLLPNLQNRPHLLSVRSNGNPYFLYLTKLNFVNYCIFIDKKIQHGYSYPRMILAHFKFDECLFNDTIFDGEMVKTNSENWLYLMNDVIVHSGTHLTEFNLIKRINLLYETMLKSFTPDIYDICRFLIKKYFMYNEGMKILNEHIESVDYSCRGIYFKPLFLKFRDVLINFDDNLVKKVERTKYKHLKSFMLQEDGKKLLDSSDTSSSSSRSSSSSSSSINEMPVQLSTSTAFTVSERDCLVRKTSLPDVYELLDDKLTLLGTACIPSLTVSKYMRELFKNKNIVDTVPIQCTFSPQFNKWVPKAP